jgi:hypothetical protein
VVGKEEKEEKEGISRERTQNDRGERQRDKGTYRERDRQIDKERGTHFRDENLLESDLIEGAVLPWREALLAALGLLDRLKLCPLDGPGEKEKERMR